jgi:hypothetical protein
VQLLLLLLLPQQPLLKQALGNPLLAKLCVNAKLAM